LTLEYFRIALATPNNCRLIISLIIGILMKILVIFSFFDFSQLIRFSISHLTEYKAATSFHGRSFSGIFIKNV